MNGKYVAAALLLSVMSPFSATAAADGLSLPQGGAKQVEDSFDRRNFTFSKLGDRYGDFKDYLRQKYGFDYATAKGYEQVYGICKEELLHRWKKNGYTRIPDAPLIEQNGMTLIPIMRQLPKSEHSLSLQSNLSLLNLPEGEWPQMDAIRLREDNDKAYLNFILQKFKKKRD